MAVEAIVSGLIQASPLYAMAAIFGLRARRLARRGRRVAPWRVVLFAGGIAVALAAQVPPIGTQSERLLSVHMVQHLLIGDVAALMIAVAMTGPVLRPILTVPGVRHLRWLAHPVVAVALWVIVYYGWHIPGLYQAALRSDLVHATQHATMFAAGLGLWLGLLGPLPKPGWFGNVAGMVYVFVVRLAGAAIANVFIWSGTPFYPTYDAIAQSRGLDAAADQSIAGAIWMLEGSIVTVGVLGWIFARWMTQGEAAQELVEYAEGRGIELDPPVPGARWLRAPASGCDDASTSRRMALTRLPMPLDVRRSALPLPQAESRPEPPTRGRHARGLDTARRCR